MQITETSIQEKSETTAIPSAAVPTKAGAAGIIPETPAIQEYAYQATDVSVLTGCAIDRRTYGTWCDAVLDECRQLLDIESEALKFRRALAWLRSLPPVAGDKEISQAEFQKHVKSYMIAGE